MSAYTWIAAERITSTGTSAYVLTQPTSLASIQKAVVQAGSSTSGTRSWYTLDGTLPAVQVGKQLISASAAVDGTVVSFHGSELSRVKLAASAAGVVWDVDYYA